MKMAYERPVMRAEMFQTNGYCGDCMDVPTAAGSVITAKVGDIKYFFSTVRIAQTNPNVGTPQYYYDEHEDYLDVSGNAGGTHFLEYSSDRNAFFIYQDATGSGLGAKDGVEYAGGLSAKPSSNSVITDGTGTLQVNGYLDAASNGGWTHAFGQTSWNANNWWRPDTVEVRNVSFTEDTHFTYSAS